MTSHGHGASSHGHGNHDYHQNNSPVIGKKTGVKRKGNLEDVSFCVNPGEVLNIA